MALGNVHSKDRFGGLYKLDFFTVPHMGSDCWFQQGQPMVGCGTMSICRATDFPQAHDSEHTPPL